MGGIAVISMMQGPGGHDEPTLPHHTEMPRRDEEKVEVEVDVDPRQETAQCLSLHMDLTNSIVGWEPELDPCNARNFSPRRKWLIISAISVMVFVTSFAATVFASGISFAESSFGNTNDELASFAVTAPVLGYLIGALLLAPASELFGRRWMLSLSNWVFVVFQICCAISPNAGALVAFRFLGGVGGAGCVTLDAGIVADLFVPDQRSAANAAAAIGVIVGPNLAPLVGGFIAQQAGWRWTFWVLTIAGACAAVFVELSIRETFAPVIIRRKTERLRKSLGREDLQSCYTRQAGLQKEASTARRMAEGFTKPLRMLLSPILLIFGLYYAFAYGLLYLLLTSLDDVFRHTYNWAADIAGLSYISLGIGSLLGLLIIGATSDRMIVRATRRNNGVYEPEMRLPHMIFFALVTAISLFWYGWTTKAGIPWIVPILALAFFGFGILGIMFMITMYVIDAFPVHAASAMASISVLRSVAGALLPLAAAKLYSELGLGSGSSVLGFIAVAALPAPWIFWRYGRVIRTRYPIDGDAL